VLFLLKNHHGEAVLLAQAATKADADEYGRTHIEDFCGESVQVDAGANETRSLKTVRVSGAQGAVAVKAKAAPRKSAFTITHVWVRGLELPEEVVEDDLLTPEDHRDLALDHIARTSDYVVQFEIRKRA
jgi:hypothetical protein